MLPDAASRPEAVPSAPWKDCEYVLAKGSTLMQMKLEMLPIPVSDVDRAIAFYADKLGFTKDVDVQPSEGVRVVQVTPEGSHCSLGFGTGLDVYKGDRAVAEACTL